MVDAVVSLAVKRLGDFLIQEVISLRGVRNEVNWLKNKLEWMLRFLKDAEEKQDGGDHRIRGWVADIRDTAYEAEDIIDKFILKVEDGGIPKRAGLKACLEMYLCIYRQANLYGIGKEIKALKNRLDEITRNKEIFGNRDIGDAGEGSSRMNEILKQLRRARPYEDDEHDVVGFKEDAELLMSELLKLKEAPYRRVISIVGMGGLGKTTLARKLYNSGSIRENFECCAWVSVSQEYNVQDLLRQTIKSFKKPTTKEELEMLEKMKEEDLEQHLRDFLGGRRYLVVIDDVWDPKAWASLRRALPDNKSGSRVIMTTRIKDVAEKSGDKTFVYDLPLLKEDESWELFCKKVDDDKMRHWPPSSKELARDMVGKCRGLPLAIVVLGGLLTRKDPEVEWPKLQKRIWRRVSEDNDDNSVPISQILASSFNDLPHQLKSCFLYIALYPEDFEVGVEKLLRLWVAEGFIQPAASASEEMDFEEVALEYLNQLIDRNLIQVSRRTWRRIETCRVHDLLRDLAIEKSKELNFLHIYDGGNTSSSSSSSAALRRRLASHCGFERFVSSFYHCSSLLLRTLLFFNTTEDRESAEITQLEFLYREVRLLRVLDLEGCQLINSSSDQVESGKRRLPDAIGKKLIHLKYLGLRLTGINELPPSVGNLLALQTLDVQNFDEVILLPDEICRNAKQLRHLLGRFKWPFRVDNLNNLRTLKYVVVVDEDQMKFNPLDLINLRELQVIFEGKGGNGLISLDSIGGLTSLQTLHLHVDEPSQFPALQPLSHCKHLLQLKLVGVTAAKLPTEMHEFLPNLKYLFLYGRPIEKDPMPVLEKLPKLTILDLFWYSGNKLACTARGFPELEILQLVHCKVEELQVDEGGMPMLRGLRLHSGNVHRIPERLKSIPAPKNWDLPGIDGWPY